MVGRGVGDEDHAGRSVHLGVGGLAGEGGVPREVLAGEDAVLVVFLRLVAQDEDDLPLHIQARVIVVMILGRGDSVTGEDHGAGQLPR